MNVYKKIKKMREGKAKEKKREEKFFKREVYERKFLNFFEDNLRVIISLLIILAISCGIYSYSIRNPHVPLSLKEEIKEEIKCDSSDLTQRQLILSSMGYFTSIDTTIWENNRGTQSEYRIFYSIYASDTPGKAERFENKEQLIKFIDSLINNKK